MRYLNLALRVILFLLLLGFAVMNDGPVTIRYFLGLEWKTSLIVVLLVFFAAGVVLGLLALIEPLWRLRRELQALKKQLPPVAETPSSIEIPR